jgi:hypothetical protein
MFDTEDEAKWRAEFGVSARTLPNGRVARSSEQRMRFMEPYPSVGGCRIRLLSVSGGAIRD